MPSQPANSSYRPEIDGLRAVAVSAVIVNHISKEWMPCGYLGVDVFFVISGYVITTSLCRHRHETFLTFISQFYTRRFKRLLPALVLFVLITSLLSSLFVPDPSLILQTGLRALFGASNVYLLEQSTDYFAPAAELNPFTHTWSLAVEEQFYLIFPVLLWCSGFLSGTSKGGRRLAIWIALITFASLAGFLALYPVHQSAAYFLMPTRFWEMAAGCLVYLAQVQHGGVKKGLRKLPPLVLLTASLGVMFMPAQLGMQATVAIVALSASLIGSLRPETLAHRLLSSRPLVGLGLISYSLYLWHWGVLSLSRHTIGIHGWSLPFQLALMLAMALLSYYWVERPLRQRPWFNGQLPILACGGAMMVGASAAIIGLQKSANHLFLGDPLISKQDETPRINGKSCRAKERFPACIARPQNTPIGKDRTHHRILILGDSHALHHGALAEQLAANLNVEVAIHAQAGYPFPANPIVRISAPDEAKQGLIMQQRAEALIGSYLRSGDVLLVVNSGSYSTNRNKQGKGDGHSSFRYPVRNWQGDDQAAFLDRLGKSISQLAAEMNKKGITVIYFLPNPVFPETEFARCNPQWFQVLNQDPSCNDKIPLATMKLRQQRTLLRTLKDHGFSPSSPNQHGSLLFFDPKQALCPALSCQRIINGQQAYTDGSHLSSHGSRLVANALMRFLKQAQLL